MTTPGNVAGGGAAALLVGGVLWALARYRAGQSPDSGTREVYQQRIARIWSSVVWGLLALIGLVALLVAAVMAIF